MANGDVMSRIALGPIMGGSRDWYTGYMGIRSGLTKSTEHPNLMLSECCLCEPRAENVVASNPEPKQSLGLLGEIASPTLSNPEAGRLSKDTPSPIPRSGVRLPILRPK